MWAGWRKRRNAARWCVWARASLGLSFQVPMTRLQNRPSIAEVPGSTVRLLISVEVERLFVGLDRITLRFPASQSTLEEFDSEEMHGFSPMQDFSAGLVTRASTVNNHVFIFRDEQRILEQFLGRNPRRSGDNLRIGQQVKRQ